VNLGGRAANREHVLVVPLGEIPHAAVEAAVVREFGSVEVTWLDRGNLRRRPWQVIARLLQWRYASAILVAPDLAQRRLRLTSLVLVLPRARRRWRMDLRGHRESWRLGPHLVRNALPIVRHVAACGLALACGEALLTLLDHFIRPRRLTRGPAPRRLLYLRSQLWLGLEGGGSVAHTAGVIGGLQQAGAEVHAVASDRLAGVTAPTEVVSPEMWFDGWLRELEDLAYNVAFFLAALRTALRVRSQAIYQRHTAFNCCGAVLSRVLRLPLILEFNSSEVWKGRYWGGLRLARMAALVERINLRAADRIVVVSEVLRRQLVAAGVSTQRVLVNPNAVDPRQFRPDAGGARVRQRLGLGSTLVVGFSGTFGAWHGIPTLAAALPMVIEARPAVRWLLIGDGPLSKLIDEAVARHRLGERVCRIGLVPHTDMPAYLAACGVLVSPHGRQADGGEFFGSPTKLFEYMAVGRPIVASAVGQIADVLVDEESALLVPPDDPPALCGAIVRLVDNACLRVRLGSAARRAAEQRHTWSHNAERVLECLQQS
jgi:glycosyltransferase involved in cell wall biosynthesis